MLTRSLSSLSSNRASIVFLSYSWNTIPVIEIQYQIMCILLNGSAQRLSSICFFTDFIYVSKVFVSPSESSYPLLSIRFTPKPYFSPLYFLNLGVPRDTSLILAISLPKTQLINVHLRIESTCLNLCHCLFSPCVFQYGIP